MTYPCIIFVIPKKLKLDGIMLLKRWVLCLIFWAETSKTDKDKNVAETPKLW